MVINANPTCLRANIPTWFHIGGLGNSVDMAFYYKIQRIIYLYIDTYIS